MVTARQAWVGLVILFLVALLIIAAAMYWQHVTGTSISHLLADGPFGGSGGTGQGC